MPLLNFLQLPLRSLSVTQRASILSHLMLDVSEVVLTELPDHSPERGGQAKRTLVRIKDLHQLVVADVFLVAPLPSLIVR